MRPAPRRQGFTLIELLVVIAIIAVLIALLVPAVQKVREAAARAQCQNNLKQLGLALHSYHSSMRRLPPGGANDQADFGGSGAGNSGQWGSSWMVYILPYIEQNALYSKWQFNSNSGAFNATNNAAANNAVIRTYLCPSSPLPLQQSMSQPGSFLSHYVGISGAANGIIPGYTETRINALPCAGTVGGGGVLAPNSKIGLLAISDGTSNTIAISEQSNYLLDSGGIRQIWLASQIWGWYLGVKSPGTVPAFDNNGGDNREPNLATLRYAINYTPPGGWPNDIAGGGVGSGGNCVGANIPLNSAHTGGANALFCDGSVRFLTDSTPVSVLGQLSTRDDGTVVPNF